MALSGTLQDFGISDILQLIGSQQKTGALLLAAEGEQVEITFSHGDVVFAAEKNRTSSNFLGNMLVRARIITAVELEAALAQQKKSMQRLGETLLLRGALSRQDLAQMARLQTAETIYRLFGWKSGTYEFEQRDVDPSKSGFDPIRAETLLLEGFRRIDEWPLLRKKVPSLELILQRVHDADLGIITARSRTVFALADGDRNVAEIIDLSRLGEFETLKSIEELLERSCVVLAEATRKSKANARKSQLRAGGESFNAILQRGVLARLLLGVGAFLVALGGLIWLAPKPVAPSDPCRGQLAARLLAHDQQQRLESALEVYRVEHGDYPPALHALVEAQLLGEPDLRYPFREPYHYQRTATGFVLLPPLD